jgi:ankyrin repeat protein
MGYTAFLLAAGGGPGGRGGGGQVNLGILDLMMQHSADVNAKVTGTKTYSFNVSRENLGNKDALSKEGTSALHEAARAVQTDIVKYLLEHGANPNILDSDGKKPIDVVGVTRGAAATVAPAAGAAAGQAAAGVAVVAAPAAAAGAGAGRGAGGRGAGGRGGPNPAAVAEVRAMLEAAAAKK